MKWAFISTLGFPPERTGGAQQSVLAICEALQTAGDTVAVACTREMRPASALRARLPFIRSTLSNAAVLGQHASVDVWRFQRIDETGWNAWAVAIRQWLVRYSPNAVVVDAGLTRDVAALLADEYRTIVSLRDVDFHTQSRLKPPTPFPSNAIYLANSHFTAERFGAAFNLPSVVLHPTVVQSRYRCTQLEPFQGNNHGQRDDRGQLADHRQPDNNGKRVLFINPEPRKGWPFVLELIRLLPQFQFRIQESWPLSKRARSVIQKEIAEFPNAVLREMVADVRNAFQDARCLIVPSQWEEAWGRVVTEAQIFGLPVIARSIGGLPESVGEGGIVLPTKLDSQEWAETITAVMTDEQLHQNLMRRGKQHIKARLSSPTEQAGQLRRLAQSKPER